MRIIKQVRYYALALLLVSVSTFAVQSPVTQMQGVANKMIGQLEKNKSNLNSRTIDQIVNRVLVPVVDMNRMAGLTVGARYWRSASSAQRAAFITQFKKMVIATYAAALSSYDGDRVRFYPLRGDYQNKRVVRVNSVIVRLNGQKIPVSYNLVRSGNAWRVYDFSVENVSIVNSYRSQFAGALSQSGLSGLTQKIKRHNAQVR